MVWLAWRQYRLELLLLGAIFAGLLAFLLPTGFERHAQYRDSGLQACLDAGLDCPALRDSLVQRYDRLSAIVGWFTVVPAFVGLILAAPMIIDVEQRTYRLAWTQSISRERWLAVHVGLAVAVAVAFSAAFTLLMTWWHAPLDRSATVSGKDLGASFTFEGVLPVAYTAFALGLALVAGVLSRRFQVAIAACVAGFVAVRVVAEYVFRVGLTSDVSFEAPPGSLAAQEATRDMERFWAVQAIEGALFALAAVLLFAIVWRLVTRRA